MNILILGSGGREHTFAYQIAKSKLCDQLFVAPGNAGTAAIATNLKVDLTDFEAIQASVIVNQIDMVVVGPEDPLVNGKAVKNAPKNLCYSTTFQRQLMQVLLRKV